MPFTRWPRSFNELIKALPGLFPHLVENTPAQIVPSPWVIDDGFPLTPPALVMNSELEPAPEPQRDPEDIVAERTRDYSAKLVASRKATKYVMELEVELARARLAETDAETALKKAHDELLAAAERV